MTVCADGCTRGWAVNSTVQLDGNAAVTASCASSIRAGGHAVVWMEEKTANSVEIVEGSNAHVQAVEDLFGKTTSFDDKD